MIVYLALLLDFILGDPRRMPHPVVLVGKIISFFEKIFYPLRYKKAAGFLFFFATVLTVAAMVMLLEYLAGFNRYLSFVVNLYFLYTALSWTSLKRETGKVTEALAGGDIAAARTYVSYVVGRDTKELTEEEMLEATIETVAENTVDGIIAPLFYIAIGYYLGLPLLFAYLYKAVNTMDSMVGYKSDRYRDFGFAAARIDDLVNYLPARLGSLLMLGAGTLLRYNGKNGWKIFRRDRKKHSSPNAGWPESVYAGLLGLRLGGPHQYFGKTVRKPSIGDPLKGPEISDHRKACRITDGTVVLFMVLFGILEVIRWI